MTKYRYITIEGELAKQRQECLRRYREKKARRGHTKMVRYQLRKINADRRPRIKGRFIKKGEEGHPEAVAAMGSQAIMREGSDSLTQDEDGSAESDDGDFQSL